MCVWKQKGVVCPCMKLHAVLSPWSTKCKRHLKHRHTHKKKKIILYYSGRPPCNLFIVYYITTVRSSFVSCRWDRSAHVNVLHAWPREKKKRAAESETTSYTVYARKPVVVGRRHGTCRSVQHVYCAAHHALHGSWMDAAWMGRCIVAKYFGTPNSVRAL